MSAPYIVISFRVLRYISSSFIFVQVMIPATYFTMETDFALMAKIIFPLFNFDFSIFLTLVFLSHLFPFFILSFIFSCFTPLASKIPRYFYPPYSIFFIIFPPDILIPSLLTTFRVFVINTSRFGYPISISMTSEKVITVFTKLSI